MIVIVFTFHNKNLVFLSEIYIQEIGRHYRLDQIFFLVPNLLSMVIEINEQEFKIDNQNSDNSACFLK